MKAEEFNTIFDCQFQLCRSTLIAKANEYADECDRLSNFKTAARLQELSPAEALGGMMAKHVVALYDFIKRGEKSYDRWEEKVTDTINYCILLLAIIQDQDQENFDE